MNDDEVIDDFKFLWRNYAMADQKSLTHEAADLRLKLLWAMRDMLADGLPVELRLPSDTVRAQFESECG